MFYLLQYIIFSLFFTLWLICQVPCHAHVPMISTILHSVIFLHFAKYVVQ